MSHEPLLIEIGCEEIPARMSGAAGRELGTRLERILDEAGLSHGNTSIWSGSRRLAVGVEAVADRQADREETLVGPPVASGVGADGSFTPAALGFARKHALDPSELVTLDTPRGRYVGVERRVAGRSLAEILSQRLPPAVESIPFPKTMRWGSGVHRWVRPVHWLLALHGPAVVPLRLFGVEADRRTEGHRFLASGPVTVEHAAQYVDVLAAHSVVVDHGERRRRLQSALDDAARAAGGRVVADEKLLDEVAHLIEWPGVVHGRFAESYLELPREILVTTLRHHQKCFCIVRPDGSLAAGFLAVANTDRDARGHVQRGNEWVVGGRLDDARFFWTEDRKTPLAARSARLARVVWHAELGSYADKAERMTRLAGRLAEQVGLAAEAVRNCRAAAALAKNDLVTGTVGEFPELQGRTGGLLLREEGAAQGTADAVYAHYQPVGPDDPVPPTVEGCVVALADKLDTVASLLRAGETATGSRDPLGLRRATGGIFRIVLERRWSLSLNGLCRLADGDGALSAFLVERWQSFLKERSYSQNEINAVLRPRVAPAEALERDLGDIEARLTALRAVREREDFALLVDLTKRVDNVLTRNAEAFAAASGRVNAALDFIEDEPVAERLWSLGQAHSRQIERLEGERRYDEVVDLLAGFVGPVAEFFERVLVIDTDRPRAMLYRSQQLAGLRDVLTRCFDIRELAGQAERRS